MLGTYFYHEVIRKTIIGFGTLFNNMEVRHETSDGTTVDIKRVPLAYGPAAKFIARLEQQPDLNKMVAITLPRMSFEMTSIAYDSSRKSGITQTFKAVDNNTNKLKRVLSLGYQPLANNLLDNKNQKAELYPLELNVCEKCFNCQLSVVIDSDKMFKNYYLLEKMKKIICFLKTALKLGLKSCINYLIYRTFLFLTM